MSGFTHLDEKGNAVMVDVSGKNATERQAVAAGAIKMRGECYNAVKSGGVSKGDVFSTARLAGIFAVKQTPSLIPLCHTLLIDSASISFETFDDTYEIRVTCTVKATGRTGVEMEALTGVAAALLTIYDMCKAMDKGMEISGIRLLEKTGGKSGHFKNTQP